MSLHACPYVPACITACSMFLCPIRPYIFRSLGSTRLVPKGMQSIAPSLYMNRIEAPSYTFTYIYIYIYIYTYIYIYVNTCTPHEQEKESPHVHHTNRRRNLVMYIIHEQEKPSPSCMCIFTRQCHWCQCLQGPGGEKGQGTYWKNGLCGNPKCASNLAVVWTPYVLMGVNIHALI